MFTKSKTQQKQSLYPAVIRRGQRQGESKAQANFRIKAKQVEFFKGK